MKERLAKLLRWVGYVWIALVFVVVNLDHNYNSSIWMILVVTGLFGIPGFALAAIAWVMDGKKV